MLGGARFFRKKGDSLKKVVILRPSIRRCGASNQTEENIVIPPRVERGPTDILKALASTVGVDYTAFHYKYPDDPYFYPFSRDKKQVLALSLESGRKSARWVFKNNPSFFKQQLSEPPIKEFFVKSAVKAQSKPTEETLLSAIEERDVLKAIKVYEALEKEDQNVSESTKQCLLELTCFYNCEEKPNEGLEEKWFLSEVSEKKKIGVWMQEGFAKKLFEKMDSSCSLANSAIIQGMLKYDEDVLAHQIFEAAKLKKVKLSVGVYNMFLLKIFKGTSGENMIELVRKTLKEMSEKRIRPNLGTLNAILHSLLFCPNFKSKINFTLEVMAEFKRLGIEPSLGSYGYFFRIISYAPALRDNYHFLSCEIMAHIEYKKFEVLHPSDLKFFKNAMTAFSYYYKDPDLLLRLLDMYSRNGNSKFILNSSDETDFFKDLISTVFDNKPIEVAMDIYRRYFFTTYNPNLKIIRQLFSSINRNQASKYLVEIWEDIKGANIQMNLAFLNELLNLVTSFSDESSLKVFHAAATSYLTALKLKSNLNISEDLNALSKILIAFVKNGDKENVLKLLEDFKEQSTIYLNQNAIEVLYNYGLSEKNVPLLLESLRIAADKKLPTVGEMASKALPFLEGDSKAWAATLMNKKEGKQKN